MKLTWRQHFGIQPESDTDYQQVAHARGVIALMLICAGLVIGVIVGVISQLPKVTP